MTTKYKLYSSEGCHLCEQALALYEQVHTLNELTVIDIVEDDKLVELYGISIPVLEKADNEEKLFWPFTADDICQLIK